MTVLDTHLSQLTEALADTTLSAFSSSLPILPGPSDTTRSPASHGDPVYECVDLARISAAESSSDVLVDGISTCGEIKQLATV